MSFNNIKVQCDQSGPYNSTRNRLDFSIDEGNTYDLSKSYLNINVKTTVVTPIAGSIHAVTAVIRDNSNDTKVLPPVSLVRNAQLSSSKIGNLETLRNVNLLRCTEKVYKLDENEQIENTYQTGVAPREENLSLSSPFTILKTLGDSAVSPSEYKDHDLSIPLSDIFGVARSDTPLNTARLGQVKMHVEMNFDKLIMDNFRKETDLVFTDSNGSRAMLDATGVYGAGGGNYGDDAIPLITTRAYNDSSESPFYLNQAITISHRIGANQAGAAVSTSNRQITKIVARADGKLGLVLNTPIVVPANQGVFPPIYPATDPNPSIRAVGIGAMNNTTNFLTINSCELQLAEFVNAPKDQPLEYVSYVTEIDHGNGLTSFHKQYTLDSNCDGVMVCFPPVPLSVVSHNALTSYRFSIDNEDTTNRNIKSKRELQYSRLYRYFGDGLKNLSQRIRQSANADGVNKTILNEALVETCPLTQKPKQLSIETEGGAIHHITLFKRFSKTV